jgi:hypothetical protein
MLLMRMDRFLRDASGVQNTAGYQIELRLRSSISRVNLEFSFPESVGLLNLDGWYGLVHQLISLYTMNGNTFLGFFKTVF